MERRFPYVVVIEGLFSADECARARALAPPLEAARIVRAATDAGRQVRDSAVAFVDRGMGTRWLFERIDDVASKANARNWGFDLQPLDALQVACYGPGQHYGWHVDLGLSGPTSLRKLSFTVQLSAADDYAGGALEILDQGASRAVSRAVGTVCLFPSFAVHRVAPVEAGERWSLVGWYKGREAFR